MNESKIFKPVELGNFIVKNAIARSATYTYMNNVEGNVGEDEFKIFEELAQNDIGLIITGQFYVNPKGMVGPGEPGLDDDKFIPRLRELTDAMHSYDAKIVVQINHAGARAYVDNPVAPSEVIIGDGRVAEELTLEEIKQIKDDFISSAYRARQSGFDGVQVHVAHGYLLTQFLSPLINKRNDIYGGSIENRFRLVKEIISGIKEACGETYPIFVKINSDAEDDEIYQNELLYMLKEFKNFGVVATELSGYQWRSYGKQDRNYYIERAAKMRKITEMPIILVGGVRSIPDMEDVLKSGIDMVSISRPLICEPDLIKKLVSGQEKSKCISCSKCFGLPLQTGKRCIQHK